MSKENGKSKKVYLYFGVIAILLIIICIYAYKVVSVELYQGEIEAERNRLLAEKEKLEAELKNVTDLQYIEQQARTQLKMIYPGEVLYILPEEVEESNDSN